jgi:branched-chain amino acid transport system substrate-binding protein
MRARSLLLAFPVLVAALAALLASAPARAEGPIPVALVYNLTGGMASIDRPGLSGALLAVEQVNAGGGVLGRPLKAVVVDGKSDVQTLRQAVAKAMEGEKPCAVVGLNDSTYAMAAAPPVMAAGVPMVTAGATWQGLPDLFGPNFFLAPFGDDDQARAMARFTVDTLGLKRVWLLSDLSHDFTRVLAANYRPVVKARGGEILDEAQYASGEKTFAAQMAAFKALPKEPEAVFISSVPPDAPVSVPALRAAGFVGPVLSGDGFDTPLLDALPPDQARTVYFATHVALDKDTPVVRNFVARYQERYGAPPDSGFAALGYDAVMLVASALGRAGSTNPAALRQALGQTRDFPAVTGTITYPPGKRVPRKPVDIIRLENGRRSFAAEVAPE